MTATALLSDYHQTQIAVSSVAAQACSFSIFDASGVALRIRYEGGITGLKTDDAGEVEVADEIFG